MSLHNALSDEKFWKIIAVWWHSLDDDRGQRAELRRAKTPAEVYISPAYRDGIVRNLTQFALTESELERLALPIGVLARVRNLTSGSHFAALFGTRGKGSPAMRDVRFRRLLAIANDNTDGMDENRDELFRMLVRMVRLTDDTATLNGLIKGGIWWNDVTKREWARQYYTHRTN